jgi:hypothetical protein
VNVSIIREIIISACAGLAAPYLLAVAQGALSSALWGPEFRFAESLSTGGAPGARFIVERLVLSGFTGASVGFIGTWLLSRLVQRLGLPHSIAFVSSFLLVILFSLTSDAKLSRVLLIFARPDLGCFLATSLAMVWFKRTADE